MSNLTMFLKGFGEDENIVEINADDTFHDQVLEDLIHHGLEGSGTVSQTKEHDQRFKKTMIGVKGCLPLISFLYPHIIIPPPNIQLGEITSSPELVYQI